MMYHPVTLLYISLLIYYRSQTDTITEAELNTRSRILTPNPSYELTKSFKSIDDITEIEENPAYTIGSLSILTKWAPAMDAKHWNIKNMFVHQRYT